MRKKMFIILTLIFLAIMCCSLVACADNTNFDGKAEITINFDKEYKDVSVNCPEGSIGQVSSTQYFIKLESTKPVDVVLICPGYESIIKSYSTKELKSGKITENVSFKDSLYRFSFRVANDEAGTDLKLAEEYKDINLTIQSGSYMLESTEPIAQDIVLKYTDDYKPMILFKESFKYTGVNGKIKGTLPLLKKDDQNAVIFIPSKQNDIQSYSVRSIYSSYNDSYTTVNTNTYVSLKIDDLSVSAYNGNIGELLTKDTLKQGYVRFESQIAKDWNIYSLNIDTSNYSFNSLELDSEFYYTSNNFGKNHILKVKEELVVGDILTFDMYDYQEGKNTYYIHIVSEEEVETGVINLQELKDNQENDLNVNLDILNDRKFTLEIVDNDGNAYEYNYLELNYENNKTEITSWDYVPNENYIFTFTDNVHSYGYNVLTIYNKIPDTSSYSGKDIYIGRILMQELLKSTDEVTNIKINYYLDIEKRPELQNKSTEVTIKYYDVVKEEFLHNQKMTYFYENQTIAKYSIEMDSFYGNEYSIVDFKDFIYYEQIFGDEIIVNVMRTYNINLNVTNYNEFNFEYGLFLFGDKGDIEINAINITQNNGRVTVKVPEIYLGKKLQFTYNNQPKYTMEIEFPEIDEIGGSIDVTIVSPDDEW